MNTGQLEPTTRRFRGSDGLTLVADEWNGAGSAAQGSEPSVLMLHGGGQNRFSWKKTGQILASRGLHVVALDSRGHGDSDRSPDAKYTIEALCADALEVIEQIGRPVVLIHGWPLNADSWEYQAVKLAEAGFRVISYDRRGFGRSGQPWEGYDYDVLSDDLAAVIETLGLTDAAIVGFSMGGGEVARYFGRHGGKGVSKAVFISSVAPGMLKSDDNPEGVTRDVFEGIREGLRQDRPAFLAEFFKDFYGQDTETGGVSDAILEWSRDMAMIGKARTKPPNSEMRMATKKPSCNFRRISPHS